jgi:hypothetical protein
MPTPIPFCAQADFESAACHLKTVIQFESKSAYMFCLKLEAVSLMAFARSEQGLFDQAEASLQRGLRELAEGEFSNPSLQSLHQRWYCSFLQRLACIYDSHLLQDEKAESCFRQCMVMLYTSGDNCSCADVRFLYLDCMKSHFKVRGCVTQELFLQLLTCIAVSIWKRFRGACRHGSPTTQLQPQIEPGLSELHATSKVALGQAVQSATIVTAAQGNTQALQILHNTITSLLSRRLH